MTSALKPIIFYHASCADGFGAAFAAWNKFGDDAEYVAMRYGQVNSMVDVDLLGAIKDRDVYILDFSFPMVVMQHIVSESSHTTWLDHHKTAFEMWTPNIELTPTSMFEYNDKRLTVCLDNGRSGALIAWDFFVDSPAPWLIKHIDDYDRWVFQYEDTKAISKALWSNTPWSFAQWERYSHALNGRDSSSYQQFIAQGNALLREHMNQVNRAVASTRVCKIGDQTGLAINAMPNLTSDAGHLIAHDSGTYGFIYYIKPDMRVNCSLRSQGTYDVSALAKLYGGGGHRNAAGFEVSIAELCEILA